MPSIICLDKNGGSDDDKRRKGLVFMGEELSKNLRDIADPRDAVEKTFKACMQDPYSLHVSSAGALTEVKKIQAGQQWQSNRKLRLRDASNKRILTVTVREDHETRKRMTVTIPDDRSKVSPGALYTDKVAEDTVDVWTNLSQNKAAEYLLSTITFRRCL